MREISREQAIKLYESKFWENMSYRERAVFELFTDKLCMPFEIFHEAVEKTLNRPVFTHEFAYPELLQAEIMGEKSPPTFEEIMNLIPEEKRILIIEG